MCRAAIARATPTSTARWPTRRASCAASITCAKTAARLVAEPVVPAVRVRVRRGPASPASVAPRVAVRAARWEWVNTLAANVRNVATSNRPVMSTVSRGRPAVVFAVGPIRIRRGPRVHRALDRADSHVRAALVRMARVPAAGVPGVRTQGDHAPAARVPEEPVLAARVRKAAVSHKAIQTHFAAGTCRRAWIRDPSRHRHAAHPRGEVHRAAALVVPVFRPTMPMDTNAARRRLAAITVAVQTAVGPVAASRPARTPAVPAIHAPVDRVRRVRGVRVMLARAAGRRVRARTARGRPTAVRGPAAVAARAAGRPEHRRKPPGHP